MSKPRRTASDCCSISEVEEYLYYADGKLFWKKDPNFSTDYIGSEAGYKAEDGYVYITLKKVKYKRSALVWCLCKKQWPSTRLLLDHINRNKQDDRLENLREVSVAENAWNRKNVKGYTWEPSRKKYKVTIMSEGKRVLIGRFDTEAEASEAYNRAKLLYHQIGETQRSGSDPNQAQENSSR